MVGVDVANLNAVKIKLQGMEDLADITAPSGVVSARTAASLEAMMPWQFPEAPMSAKSHEALPHLFL